MPPPETWGDMQRREFITLMAVRLCVAACRAGAAADAGDWLS